MDLKFQEKLKAQLLSEEESLEKELSKIADKDKTLEHDYDARFPNYGSEEEQNAQEVAQYDQSLDMEAKLEVKLKNVKNALIRIEKGTYGQCAACGKEINPERLEALPSATLCVECQNKK